MSYALFGPYMPGMLVHPGASVSQLVNHLYLTTPGIYGIALGVVATYVFHFVLFGVFATRIGLGQLFLDSRHGSPAATRRPGQGIDLRLGPVRHDLRLVGRQRRHRRLIDHPGDDQARLPRHFAAAVEAASSTGGQITPPMMGAAAFLMIEFLELPYTTIILAAIVPAFMHFFGVFMQVHFEAKRRDVYDVRGRTAHESLFNAANGTYRGPGSQQGYSPFTTWTRGLAWAMLGFAEQVEFLDTVDKQELASLELDTSALFDAACATCDFYIERAAAADGIPYWDTGAPGLAALGDWGARAADPFNGHEPVDSSAAAIAAQGLLRLGKIVSGRGGEGRRYEQAGLRVLATLIDGDQPYLGVDASHQGLLRHSVYHRPNGWDHVPAGSRIPRGESSMWGDYHLREAALYVKRQAEGGAYLTFFGRRDTRA